MSFKFCARCKFAVRKTSKLCAICGHTSFVTNAADVHELIEQPSPAAHLCKGAALLGKELLDQAVETAEKTVRASRQMMDLLRGSKIESSEPSEKAL